MKFGVLKDIKNGEYRVVATPAEVSLIAGDGHEVYVASKAGYAAGFDDKEYAAAVRQSWQLTKKSGQSVIL